MKHLRQTFLLCLLWMVGMASYAEEIPNDEIWYEASSKLVEKNWTIDGALSYYDGIEVLQPYTFNVTISSHTFSNGKGIIKFNGNVTRIGSLAFYCCSGLTSITIPNSVTSIERTTFYHCTNLTNIIVKSGNTKYDSRNNCNAIIETSTNSLIVGCKNTVIPNSVTSIGDRAFQQCSNLTSITIPNSVTSIGDYAFNGCNCGA